MVPSGQHSLQKARDEMDSCGRGSSTRKRTWNWQLSGAPLTPKVPSCEASAQRCGNDQLCPENQASAGAASHLGHLSSTVPTWRACPPSWSDPPANWLPANPLPSLTPHGRPPTSQSVHPSPAPSAPLSRHWTSGTLLRDQLSLTGVENRSPHSGAGTFNPGGPGTAAGTKLPALCPNRGPPSPLPGAAEGFWDLIPVGVLQADSLAIQARHGHREAQHCAQSKEGTRDLEKRKTTHTTAGTKHQRQKLFISEQDVGAQQQVFFHNCI